MKKVLLASACLFALAAPASAADLAARPYTKAPVAVASVYNWTGFYIGANAGGGSSHNCWDTTAVAGGAVPVTAEGCHNATGALVGGQIGYRWQSTNWVFGLEAQGDWADLKGSNTSSPAAFFPLVNNTKIDAIGLFTGQVGYAWNNVLWYVKGGAAVTHNKFSGTLGGVTFGEATDTRWGGAVGTGIEFGFAPNWSVALEYDHLFMGKHTDSFTAFGLPFRADSIKQDVDMATVRLNYTFGGGAVVAKY
ncbi:outer membrane beta-barrel protein [Bradyrhizobium sp. SSUT77]|uniref:outer membrane protein n=1 Tax=Bradyrhizobium sp. SSUT77 TaxID=3040603 RepID=UPI00244B4563|nr:outer membrane beta-barrel protein [Bradyrhizobium sp. SSUT77]MDH2342285.1 outer membrane beta-barrel protein [Bradyrhizobium sp. SSUT77]